MTIQEHTAQIERTFHKAFYWKVAAFGTLCIHQEYQIYEQLAKNRFFDMSTHLKKAVNRFWRAVTTGYAMDEKYLLIIEESFFEPRDAWEELALQIVQDIQDLYYAVWKKDAQKTLKVAGRQFSLLEKYSTLIGENFSVEQPMVKRAIEQQTSWAEELVAISKQDKKSYLADLPKREIPIFIDADIMAARTQMPKEKKSKKQLPELRYMSLYVEEERKHYMENIQERKQCLEDALQKELEEQEDVVAQKHELIHIYERLAKYVYIVEHDRKKALEYYYLAACAARECVLSFRQGKRVLSWHKQRINRELETGSTRHFLLKSAILIGNYDIALEIASRDSLEGAMLLGEDERAKDYLPKDFSQIGKYDKYWDGVLWAILYRDEKLMNDCIKAYIKTVRWEAKNFNSAILVADYTLSLVRLAQDRGMKCNIDIYELPLELLEK